MSNFARELFARLLVATPGEWDPVEHKYCERTDEELDALVKYAMRAEAACERESRAQARERQSLHQPRPLPTGVPR